MVSWCKQGEYNAQGYQKSELCGFKWANTHSKCVHGGMFARRAPGALLLDYVPPEEPPSTPLGNTLRIR